MSTTSFFGGAFFGGEFFTQGGEAPEELVVKIGIGGIEEGGGRHHIFKPTGTLHLPKKRSTVPTVVDRIDESREIQAEVAAQLAKEFSEDNVAFAKRHVREVIVPISTMSLHDIEAEIAVLLKKKLKTEEDEIMLLLLMVSAFA